MPSSFVPGLKAHGIELCIPPKSNCKAEIPFDKTLCKGRHKIENIFGKIKYSRRIHNRYDGSAQSVMSAIAMVAAVIFWITQ